MKETSTKQALLHALREAPGSWQSGGALAQKLGVSRNAVWKAANDLRAEGFDLQSVPRRGYLLQQGGDLLTSEELCVQLGAGWGAEAHASLPSTNQRARQLALDGQKGPFLVAAETQTAGRGRRGRTFYSPPHSGLYFSLLCTPTLTAENATLVTAAAAVAARRVLVRLGAEVQIKWVNDLFCGPYKIAGILTEAATDFESGFISQLIVGFGINLTLPQGGFGPGLDGVAGAAFASLPPLGRAGIAAAIANEFLPLLQGLPRQTDFLDEYRAASLLTGREVTVTPAVGTPYRATAGQVDDAARLPVTLPDGTTLLLLGGEVSLRPDDF